MSQNEEVEELDTQVDSEVATDEENEQEDNTPSDDEITYDQALAWKKSLEKANKKIVALEKGKKLEKVETPKETLSEDNLDALLDKREFYKDNTSAKELREEIEAMVSASKGKVTREKAYAMLSGDAEIEENRKVYAKSVVEGNNGGGTGFSPISMEKYDKLSASEQKAYNDRSKAKNGGVVFK